MRILVIGSEGNIGRHLVSWLRHEGHEVHRCDILPAWLPDYTQADILQPGDLVPLFASWKPEVVYHLAAMVSRPTCEAAAHMAVNINVGGTNNIAQLCVQFGAKMIFFSTSEVYGNDVPVQVETADPKPNNRYGLTKWMCEKIVEYEIANHGLNAVVLRPFMFYHEDESHGKHRSAMIHFAEALVNRRPVLVHRNSRRGWLHLDDGVRALERAAQVPIFTTINIGNPGIVSTEELAKLMCHFLGLDPAQYIQLEDLPARMTLRKEPVLDRQREFLQFEPRVSLEEGVQRVLRGFGANV